MSIVLMLIGFVFRGPVYRKIVAYKSLAERPNYSIKNTNLINYIEANVPKKDTLQIEEIIRVSLKITSRKLRFTASNNYSDPNKLIRSKTANCIGYASFFSSVCNYLFKKYDQNNWVAKPKVGLIYLFGENVHLHFDSPFLKDHDFVTIENTFTKQSFAVDPSVNDYLFIDFIETF